MAMEKVFTRHVASDRMVSGAYKSEYGENEEIQACIHRVEVSSVLWCVGMKTRLIIIGFWVQIPLLPSSLVPMNTRPAYREWR